MDDLISRQAAIDALGEEPPVWYDGEDEIAEQNQWKRDIEAIKQLLPIQAEPCEDAVSREKVKELAYSQIRSEYSGIALKEQREAMLRIADNVIGLLPSVTPKQRTGKWIHVSEEMWKCDQCGEISCCSPRYCPDCGSRNEATE